MMELVGVFSFCCYRQFINFMAQMPSFMVQIRHSFFLRHPLHNLFSLCGNRYHNGTNICSIDEAPYTNRKKSRERTLIHLSPEVTYDTLPEWSLSGRNNLSFFRLYHTAGTTQKQRQPARPKLPQIPKRKMITEITATTETVGMATTMAGKKENPVETAEETGTATVGMATVEMATTEMEAEIPITREEAETRAES